MTPEEYQYIVEQLSQSLESGAIEQDDFKETLAKIAAIVLLLLFLRGAKKKKGELSAEERALIADNVNLAHSATGIWAGEIVAGRYTESEDTPQPAASLVQRAILWAAAALGMVAAGQLFQADDPYWEWVYSPEKVHCEDCLRLNGQVHRASEWRASGWQPQSFSLECRGFHCGCFWREAEGPSRGSF